MNRKKSIMVGLRSLKHEPLQKKKAFEVKNLCMQVPHKVKASDTK
jgi:hypothetical protein